MNSSSARCGAGRGGWAEQSRAEQPSRGNIAASGIFNVLEASRLTLRDAGPIREREFEGGPARLAGIGSWKRERRASGERKGITGFIDSIQRRRRIGQRAGWGGRDG
jgi:hypothetical protein